MYTYVVDESFCSPHFFIFGGITIDSEIEVEIKNKLRIIRNTATSGILPPEVEIKWNYSPKDCPINEKDHTSIKKLILEMVGSYTKDKLGIFLYAVPYERFENNGWLSYTYAMNVCFNKFEDFLASKHTHGSILIDEFQAVKTKNPDGSYTVLTKDKLRGHLQYYVLNLYNAGTDTKTMDNLSLIIPNINSILNPFHQINDLILGSFQYYILKAMTSDPAKKLAIDMVKKYIDNFHTTNFISPGKYPIFNAGFSLYPLHRTAYCDRKIDDLILALKKDLNFI